MAAAPIAFGYVRFSTSQQASSGLGLDAQRTAITAACKQRGWELRAIHEDAGVSSGARSRPGLEAAEAACVATPGAILVVSRLDRLARSLIALAGMLERARWHGWRLLALDAPDTDTAVVVMLAQLEQRLHGERIRDALAAAKARGVHLGHPVAVPDDVRDEMLALRREGWTATRIAAHLQAQGIPAPRGDRWHMSTVANTINRNGGHFKRGRPAKKRGEQ